MKDIIPTDHHIHVHCFTSSEKLAAKLLSNWRNLYIGFTGVITFPSAQNDLVAKLLKNEVVPLARIVLETDGPFMAPLPHRGKPCHSGYIPYIAKFLADIKGVSIDEVYTVTTNNAVKLYNLPSVNFNHN